MRLLNISLALSLSVLAVVAYPQQQQQQQYPFGAVHPHHADKTDSEDTGYARFDNEQVLRVQISTMDELKQLEAIVEDKNLDLWSNLRIGTVDVRVPASELSAFQTAIPFPATVMISNVQDLIPEEAPAVTLQQQQNIAPAWNFTDNSFWLNYHDLATLNNLTETMVYQFPDLVKRTTIGYTYEGREVFGMTIHGYKQRDDDDDDEGDEDEDDKDSKIQKYSKKMKNLKQTMKETVDEMEDEVEELVQDARSWWSWLFDTSRGSPDYYHKKHDLKKKKPSKPKKHPKAIIFHGGQHAREWIGPATVSYIAKELILGYGKNKKITRLLDQFEFVIVPVLNADGYAYTWERNRMWRKNREPTSIPFCSGIDPNRNWGYLWNNGGSSSNPCSEAYHGPAAFAAHEPKMMSEFITKKDNVVAYIDFHSYSQLWMTPFGADCSKTPKDDEDLMEAGLGAAKALKDVHGTKFAVGSVCNIIYQASGGSLDWTYAEGGVKYSYAVELRDTGLHGFLLPEDQILPSGEETFASVIHLANFIRKREKQWGYMV
ncbi:Carboxypeptidase A4 [Mortierella claussenii]|nr:Carboxypeptidase A4 [Mortierella claussenii]